MIKFNEVTWYSKLAAIIFFIGVLPVLTFYIGTQYEASVIASNTPTQIIVLNNTPEVVDVTPEKIATDFVNNNSAGVEFTLKKDFDNGTFIKFYVIPTGKDAGKVDEARIFLKKTPSGYNVIGFGTAFPGLEEQYPELKGQI